MGLDLAPFLLGELNFGQLPQQLVNGLLLGAIYALIALGYTMVYGVLRLINFAHGEVFMLGAYVALFVSIALGYSSDAVGITDKGSSLGNLALMLLASMIACAIIGMLIEFFAYKPMRKHSRIALLITAIGVSLCLQYGGQLFLPSTPPPSIREEVVPADLRVSSTFFLSSPPKEMVDAQKTAAEDLATLKVEFDQVVEENGGNQFNLPPEGEALKKEYQAAEAGLRNAQADIEQNSVAITIPKGQLLMFGAVVVLMLALWWLVMFTKVGRAMRAASHDFDTASLMGINVNWIVTLTFMIGSALAGAGAMMNATFLGTPLTPFYGFLPGVKAFIAAVLGGIGNIPGAVVGGIVMGLAETLVVWAGYSSFRDAIAFIILIVVLLFRPGGILGSSKVEKV